MDFNNTVFSVLDFETTGLSPHKGHKIIEVAITKIENGEITTTFSKKVNPKRDIPKEATDINGITNEVVKYAEPIEKILPGLFKYLEGTTIVAHNAAFDLRFLNYELKKVNMPLLQEAVCTLDILRNLQKEGKYPKEKKKSLSEVCKHYGIQQEEFHKAANDTTATAELLLRLQKNHTEYIKTRIFCKDIEESKDINFNSNKNNNQESKVVDLRTRKEEKEKVKEGAKKGLNLQNIIDGVTPVKSVSEFVSLYFHTTGINFKEGDQIIEISAIKYKENKIVDRYSRKLSADREISLKMSSISGLTSEDTSDCVKFKLVAKDLRNFIGSKLVVCYNAEFYMNFLNYHFEQNKIPYIKNYICLKKELLTIFDESLIGEIETTHRNFGIPLYNLTGSDKAALAFASLFKKLKQYILHHNTNITSSIVSVDEINSIERKDIRDEVLEVFINGNKTDKVLVGIYKDSRILVGCDNADIDIDTESIVLDILNNFKLRGIDDLSDKMSEIAWGGNLSKENTGSGYLKRISKVSSQVLDLEQIEKYKKGLTSLFKSIKSIVPAKKVSK